ncbi:VanW family protein [Synechococcus sp. CS-1328]|nr:VanW family protein [Synechococcus sp. CS-1328]
MVTPHDASTNLGLQQLRRWLPLELRQRVLAVKRHLNDRRQAVRWSEAVGWSEARNGHEAVHGGEAAAAVGMAAVAELEQPVLPSELLANKLANLQLAIAQLNGTLLPPGHTWSFWRLVGRPGRRRGYLLGRNLVDGRLVPQRGGGLCQLAGLVYHLALLAGVEVVERHAHSVDLYTDDNRFTPLGADAAVVWGVKDLRLVNPHPVPLRLGCQLAGQRLLGRLEAPLPLRPREVRFEAVEPGANRVRVHTLVDGTVIQSSSYHRSPPAQPPAPGS